MVTLSAGILTPDLLGLCQALSLLTFSPTLAVNNRRFGPSPSPRLLSVQANRQSETSMGCLPEGEAVLTRPMSFKEDDIKVMGSFRSQKGESDTLPTPKSSNKPVFQQSPSFNYWGPEKNNEANFSFTPSLEAAPQSGKDTANRVDNEVAPAAAAEVPLYRLLSPRPKPELDEFATKVQKVYKSYRTRRNLADAAVVVEELWWKALDYASLNISSVSFYHNDGKPEKAVSRWSRAKKRLAKVGKGLSQDEKAQKLAIQHWLEAIDPRHRYGHNLHLYYENWRDCKSTQPFFYWLDVGEGQEVDLKVCPRSRLQSQIIKYLGPVSSLSHNFTSTAKMKTGVVNSLLNYMVWLLSDIYHFNTWQTERESYEVVVVNGRLFYKTDQLPLNTTKDSKWIFVLSTSRILYVGQKKKGTFQHSSFLSGAAIIAAGRLIAEDGYVKRIWRHSGHYHPTEENLSEFMAFLTGSHVDLSGVKISGTDNDDYCDNVEITSASTAADMVEARAPTPKWCTGTGPRIGCVRDYPVDLQVKALEQVRLSPRIPPSPVENNVPIPSPRPSPKLRISPHLSRMGFSPRTYPADLRSPVVKSSPKTSFAGFPQPKVTLRLPSSRGRKCR